MYINDLTPLMFLRDTLWIIERRVLLTSITRENVKKKKRLQHMVKFIMSKNLLSFMIGRNPFTFISLVKQLFLTTKIRLRKNVIFLVF